MSRIFIITLQIGCYKTDYEGSFLCYMYTTIIQSNYGFICVFVSYILIRKHFFFPISALSAMVSEHNRLKSCRSCLCFSTAFRKRQTLCADCCNVDIDKLKMPFFFFSITLIYISQSPFIKTL